MRLKLTCVAAFVGLLAVGASAQVAAIPVMKSPRVVVNFDDSWRFSRVDAAGAQAPDFADDSWQKLAVPHDWSIEGPFSADAPTRGSGGFLPAGTGWYRKQFTLPAEYAGRRVLVDFDGVMANSEVFVNGVSVGKRPYGYVSFQYDLDQTRAF
jgi:beta-galactosidase